MNAPAMKNIDDRKSLKEFFDQILDMEAQKKTIAESIDEVAGDACEKFGISKRGFKTALKYYAMSDGERTDLHYSLELAQKAMDDRETEDLFHGQTFKMNASWRNRSSVSLSSIAFCATQASSADRFFPHLNAVLNRTWICRISPASPQLASMLSAMVFFCASMSRIWSKNSFRLFLSSIFFIAGVFMGHGVGQGARRASSRCMDLRPDSRRREDQPVSDPCLGSEHAPSASTDRASTDRQAFSYRISGNSLGPDPLIHRVMHEACPHKRGRYRERVQEGPVQAYPGEDVENPFFAHV